MCNVEHTNIHFFSDLPLPDVSITILENYIAGLNTSLQCSASVANGLVVKPLLELLSPNGTVLASLQNDTLTYLFSPLLLSDEGQYSCIATINIPEINITGLQKSSNTNITVVGKFRMQAYES